MGGFCEKELQVWSLFPLLPTSFSPKDMIFNSVMVRSINSFSNWPLAFLNSNITREGWWGQLPQVLTEVGLGAGRSENVVAAGSCLYTIVNCKSLLPLYPGHQATSQHCCSSKSPVSSSIRSSAHDNSGSPFIDFYGYWISNNKINSFKLSPCKQLPQASYPIALCHGTFLPT